MLNPDKFQFAEKSIDFAGFRVSDSTIEPLPKYLDAIRDFPSPTSTTDIRSWFGLVNQVANYVQLRDIMEPFKPFLSPRCKFSWSPQLEEAFQLSKDAIICTIREGVEIFDMQRRTCLRPDWSTRGIGYFLLQQHCSCSSGIPDCCPGGWRIALAGSRFLTLAEQCYAAIEGEALTVAWGLEQTRYFTQGCDNLVITDHKPLVKIFGDRTLDEITNSRLFRPKQRTLPCRFDIKHLPGKTNHAADATSRHPSLSGSENAENNTSHGVSSIPDLVDSATDGIYLPRHSGHGYHLMVPPRTHDGFRQTPGTPSLVRNNRSLVPFGPSASPCMHRRVSFYLIRTVSSYPHHSAPTYCRTST